MIKPRSLSLISNRIYSEQGGRRIPESTIELDYCLAWFLTKLADHPLNNSLAFKGGTCLRRCHIPEYRFSEDMDFTRTDKSVFVDIQRGFKQICDAMKSDSGITMVYKDMDRHPHSNSYTFRMAYIGPIGKEREVKVDITKDEKIVRPLEKKPLLRSYPEFSDIPTGPLVTAYSIDEIIIEKILALSDKSRCQPRDLYDLWNLTNSGKVDIGGIGCDLLPKLYHHKRRTDTVDSEIDSKEGKLRSAWSTRLEAQMSSVPEFDGAFRHVRRFVKGVLEVSREIERNNRAADDDGRGGAGNKPNNYKNHEHEM